MFNENDIVLNLAVLSDIHMSGVWDTEPHFKDIIQICKRRAGDKLDAFLMNGDFTDAMNSRPNVVVGAYGLPNTYEEAKAVQNAKEFRILRNAFSTIDEDTEIIYTLGNHDGADNFERFITEFSSRDEIGDNENFERMYRTDLDFEAIYKGVRHCVVGGYHVLCLNPLTDYTEALEILKTWLDDITAAEPEKFVFLLYHYRLTDTVMFGNFSPSNKQLSDMLKQYPQVVALTGHTHSPLQNERAIWQGEYTVVEASSCSYILHSQVTEPNVKSIFNTYQTQGLLMQLDGAGNLRIHKLNFKNDSTIGEPWEIPKPAADRSHLKCYTNERAKRYPAPCFPKDVTISLSPEDAETTAISFPAATHEDMVYRYEVIVSNEFGSSQIFYLSSLFCHENPADKTVTAVLPYAYDKIYRLSVTPQDVWLKCGEPLHFYKVYTNS